MVCLSRFYVLATLALFVGAFCLLIPSSVVDAQESWQWPEKPENLKVLPSDWTGKRLRPVMMGFTRALGVRCSHCHVGEEGQPLTTYDFPSDENPNKDVARAMLNMLGDINDHLKKIEPSGEERVNMWCHTCHRGRPRPMTLGEELTEKFKADGADAALSHYGVLREEFYGRGAYDFGEESLNEIGYAILGMGQIETAIKVFQLNVEQFPESGNAYDSLAEAHMKAGNKDLAIEFYEKSLEKNPKNKSAEEKLKELKGSTE